MNVARFNIKRIIMILTVWISLPGVGTSIAGNALDSLDGIKKGMARADRMKGEIILPDHHDQSAEDAARSAVDRFESREFQAHVNDQKERLKRDFFQKQFTKTTPQQKASPAVSVLKKNERLYLFISSSIPIDTLRQYAVDMDAINDPRAVMVMRGFIGGIKKARPTLDFVSRVMVKDKTCDYLTKPCDRYPQGAQVDPMLFTRYKINSVPALVYVTGVTQHQPGSEGVGENTTAGERWVVYGDAGLGYMLERLRAASKSESLKKMTDILTQKGFFDDNRE